MKVVGSMSFGNKKVIGSMANKQNELKIGEMAKISKQDKKSLQIHADLAKLAEKK